MLGGSVVRMLQGKEKDEGLQKAALWYQSISGMSIGIGIWI